MHNGQTLYTLIGFGYINKKTKDKSQKAVLLVKILYLSLRKGSFFVRRKRKLFAEEKNNARQHLSATG